MSEKKKTESKPPRKRTTSLAEVFCGVGNCEYSSKYNAYVTKHRQQAHQTHVVLDQSAMDRSVSYSEVFDTTASTGSLGEKTSQELYDAMAKAPSSTLKCVQTVDRRRKRSKEESEDDEDKKLKLDTDSQVKAALSTSVSQSQSPEKAVRDEIMRQAKEAMEKKEEEAETEEEQELSVNLMAENDNSPKDSDSENYVTSLENETTAPTNEENHELSHVSDSLSLTYSGNRENQEVKDLESELQAKTRSLQDALSDVNELTVKVATVQRKLEDSLIKNENLSKKLKAKETEVRDQAIVIADLTANIKEPAKHDAKKIKALQTKVKTLEKKLEDSLNEVKKTAAAAEQQRSIAASYETMHKDLKSEITRMKRATLCKDDNCRSEKECGRSHTKKEENNGPCRYYFFGKCTKGKDCPYKHDPIAKKAFFDQRNKEKEEKEKAKKEESTTDQGGVELNDDDEGGKKDEEEKKKRKKTKKGKKKDGASEPMDTSNTGGAGKAKPNSAVTPSAFPSSATSAAATPVVSQPQHQPQQMHMLQQQPTQAPQQHMFTRPPPPVIPPNFQFGAQTIPIGAFSFNGQPQNIQHAHHTYGRGPQAGGAVQNWQPQLPSSEELMRARQEAAIQHQTLSRRLQLDQLRAELSNVQSQIHASHNQPPGTYNLQELVFQEANLMQRLTEAGKFNPGL